MKKQDMILLGGVLAAALLLLGVYLLMKKDGAVVEVFKDQKLYGTYSLGEDARIPIGDTNVLVIEDGYAYMAEADCPDQLCMQQGKISKTGETIVCLPNKIVVEIHQGENNDLDQMAG